MLAGERLNELGLVSAAVKFTDLFMPVFLLLH